MIKVQPRVVLEVVKVVLDQAWWERLPRVPFLHLPFLTQVPREVLISSFVQPVGHDSHRDSLSVASPRGRVQARHGRDVSLEQTDIDPLILPIRNVKNSILSIS